MKARTVISTFIGLLLYPCAHALVLDQTHETAALLGFQVLGEVEFSKAATQPNPDQLAALKEELFRNCSGSGGKILLLAWSDQEYPTQNKGRHSAQEIALARRRALILGELLLSSAGAQPEISMVNMATRVPFLSVKAKT